MKKALFAKIALMTVLSLLLLTLAAQVPQGFNFQGVARNSNGSVLASTPVTLRISVITAESTTVWVETHSVTTSDIGLFNITIGSGTRTGGLAQNFSDINWAAGQYSVKVELNTGSGFENMGTSELKSVPYAMVAGTIAKLPELPALSTLDIVENLDHNPDSALFKIKNKDGNTIFAVYNEGVRINVADYPDAVKASKGGFAIGGFGQSKGETNEYLRVSPDSVRIYVDEATSKGSKGGFAIGGFGLEKGVTDFMHMTPENYFIGHMAGDAITTGLYNSFFGYDAGVSNTEGNNNVFIGNETGYSNLDGNWNIFIGNTAGYSNSTGDANIILGDEAGYSNTTGSWNVFLGDLAGHDNETGESNVFIGADAGLSNTIGSYNVFLGSTAGYSNTEGTSNVFLGESAGFTNTTGNSNVFIGNESGAMNETGDYNVFMGEVAGWSNTIGVDNVFIGASAGENNDEGNYNVFIGSSSGNANTSGNYNVFLGEQSGSSNEIGISNVFLGKEAGTSNISGSYNVFLGTLTGQENTSGEQNVFLGQEAGSANMTGNYNVSIGTLSGSSNVAGSSNVFIGHKAGIDEVESNRLYIDNSGLPWDEAFIYGEFDNNYLRFYANVDVAGWLYYYDIFGKSDEKLKTDITDLSGQLDKVLALRPVTYSWNEELVPKGAISKGPQIGLIAQEVEKLFPDLVQTDKKGEKAVNYTKLSVVLIEAIQEQQSVIEMLKTENAAQQKSLEELNSKVDALIGSLNK